MLVLHCMRTYGKPVSFEAFQTGSIEFDSLPGRPGFHVPTLPVDPRCRRMSWMIARRFVQELPMGGSIQPPHACPCKDIAGLLCSVTTALVQEALIRN